MEKTQHFHRRASVVVFWMVITLVTAFPSSSITTLSHSATVQRRTTTQHHVAFLPDMGDNKFMLTKQAIPTTKDDKKDSNNKSHSLVSSSSSLSSSAITTTPSSLAKTKFSMIAYIVSMCLALPITLFPTWAMYKAGLITTLQKEQLSLRTAEQCARSLFTIIPFANVTIVSDEDHLQTTTTTPPEPSIWCANHVSAIDTFLFMATDDKLRGKARRPIKVVYWKGLDENPVTKLVFHMAGFIPVQMKANGSGNANEYDSGSFLTMLRLVKQAFKDGFDVFILPEGQLNPTPELGLLPVFSGAFALARMSHRPIRFVGVYGTHQLWHADDTIGMTVTGRGVTMKTYPTRYHFETADEFVSTFTTMLGYFGKTGQDLLLP